MITAFWPFNWDHPLHCTETLALSTCIIIKALFKLLDGELVVCVADQGRAKPCKARLAMKKWVTTDFLGLITNPSYANSPLCKIQPFSSCPLHTVVTSLPLQYISYIINHVSVQCCQMQNFNVDRLWCSAMEYYNVQCSAVEYCNIQCSAWLLNTIVAPVTHTASHLFFAVHHLYRVL